jgi:hypothetical protein
MGKHRAVSASILESGLDQCVVEGCRPLKNTFQQSELRGRDTGQEASGREPGATASRGLSHL